MKYLFVTVICILSLSSCFLGAGSYANSESYIVDIPYKDAEAIMKKLKETYPEYQYYVAQDSGKMKKSEDNDGFFIYYLPNINHVVSCMILSLEDPQQTRILLISTGNPKIDRTWKRINTSELTREENKKIKKEFENQILDKIGKWHNDSFSFFD